MPSRSSGTASFPRGETVSRTPRPSREGTGARVVDAGGAGISSRVDIAGMVKEAFTPPQAAIPVAD
jgi:hypothetical protein